jgi:Secretion system C-terminal sorting domain/Calx-beta domain
MTKISTKLFTACTVAFLLLFATTKIHAQCMLLPISLANRVANATTIIEGKVIAKQCLWDEQARNIYTMYDVEVYTTYKGSVANNIIKLVDAGGTIGFQKDEVTNDLHLNIGNAGIFLLIPTNDPFSANLNYMEAYAGPQGFVAYSKADKKANCIFESYSNVQSQLFSVLENLVGSNKIVTKTLDWNSIVDNRNEQEDNSTNTFTAAQSNAAQSNNFTASSSNALIAAGAMISSFSPSIINAGTYSVLTVNGTGFGATQGTSTVQFKNADDGGLSFIAPLPSQYIAWSNTQIQVIVPSPAGTGQFRVTDGTNTVTSASDLTVNYHVTNFNYNIGAADTAYIAKHINANANGGYTFQCYTGFASNAAAFADFTALAQAWRCTSGINWIVGANSTINTVANDGVNIIRFDIGAELSAGVLGVATSRYNGCITGSGVTFYVQEIDVVFDDATNWFYGNVGTPSPSQSDFYSVGVHELGHGHQLGHVIDAAKIMHFSITTGMQNRTLSPAEIAGGDYVVNLGVANPYCNKPLHTKYACIPKVTLTASTNSISENTTSLTITATMNGVNNAAVVINLGTSGSATGSGTDYNLPASITVPAGTNTASITMSIINDAIFEGNENAIIDITSVTNGIEDGVQQQIITIVDDETPPIITLSASCASMNENGGSCSITASQSGISALPTIVKVLYTGTAISGTDYVVADTIVIPLGSLSSQINVSAIDDALNENTETIIVNIDAVINGVAAANQIVTINIIDDENAEFDLYQNANLVINNTTQNFGNITIGNSASKIYTIKNTGNFPLTWSAAISGANASRFVLQTTGAISPIPTGDSTQFTIIATPICGDNALTATINFMNNDDDENPTNIALQATAIDVAPVPNAMSLPTVYGLCNASVSAPMATDFCDGMVMATTTSATNFSTQGTFTITWIYTDSKANTATQNQTVIINDTVSPVPTITVLPTITANCDTMISVNPTATDNCNGTIIASTSSALTYSGAGTYTIVWNYVDANGNSATQNQTVVIANDIPSITITNNNTTLCQNNVATLSATATAGGSISWSNGIVNGQNFVVTASAIYTVTATSMAGCIGTSTTSIGVNNTTQISNATANNAASIAGNTCDVKTHIDGATINYADSACHAIVSITDALGGNVLGNVNACVQVDAMVPLYNGQPYLPRHFDIIPASQGAANLVFYYTQADFDAYNLSATSLGFPTITPNGLGNLAFSISQVPGGSLASSNSATTIAHSVVASFDAAASRWQVPLSVASFSGFFAHATNPNNAPLSIGNIALIGHATKEGQLLNWQVSMQNDMQYYTILHSSNGLNFAPITTMAQHATINNKYNYLHPTQVAGNHYYKIIGTMHNGEEAISNVVRISNNNKLQTINVYPNPATDVLQVQTSNNNAALYTFVLRDAIGKTIKTIYAPLEIGIQTTTIDVHNISAGLYTLQVLANGKSEGTVLVKIK